jgi:hypothetical protein
VVPMSAQVWCYCRVPDKTFVWSSKARRERRILPWRTGPAFVEAVGGAGRPPQADDGIQFLGPKLVVAEVLVLVHAHLRPGGKQWPPSDTNM